MPEDFHTLPAKRDIQQSAAKSVECWNGCYVFFVFLSSWWYQIGRQPVGCRLKTAGKSAYFGRLSRLGAVWLVQPVGCYLAGAAGGPHGRLASWFSQAGSASQRSNSITSHTKYFKSAQNWIDSLYLPYLQLAHTWAIFPM